MLIFLKKFTLFVIMFFTSLFCQFTEVNVVIDKRQIKENDKFIFETLSEDISQYFLNNKFLEYHFELELFIDIHIIIESYSKSDNNKIVNAQLIITNNTDQQFYTKGIDFPYSKGESLIFNSMYSPLTSILDYYAYIFLATELDTYDYLGGDAYFVKSDEIAKIGRGSDYSRGWDSRRKKTIKLKENRNLRSIRFYYFLIQDNLNSDNIDNKFINSYLEQIIDNLYSIFEIYGNERYTSLFLNEYGQELAKLFFKNEHIEAIILLIDVNPDNQSIYSKYLDK